MQRAGDLPMSDDDDDFERPEADDDADMRATLLDAGAVAACAIVNGIKSSNPDTAAAARAPGAVVILISPAPEWSLDVANAWQPIIVGCAAVSPSADRWRKKSILYVYIPADDRSRICRQDCDSKLADAVADGRGALLVVTDTDTLTATERAAADVIVKIPQITAAQLRSVAEKLGTGNATLPDAEMPTSASPAAMRLAMRPGQTADAYLRRLKAFTDALDLGKQSGIGSPFVPGLDGLFGMDEAVRWGRDLAKDMKAYACGELEWSSVPPGCLLSGPAGVGKTVFAYRLAKECAVPIVVTSYSDWQSADSGHLGTLTKCLRARFAEARKLAPSILFIDEIDSVSSRGSGGTTDNREWFAAIINALLFEFGNPLSLVGVVVVAASNFADRVDPALRRAGRLDTEIRISAPSVDALIKILGGQTPDLRGVDMSPVALRLAGGTGADCERAVRGARQRARHAGRPMSIDDLMAEVTGKDSGHRASRRTAIHEAAHAVVVAATRPKDIVALSVQKSRGNLGGLLLEFGNEVATADGVTAIVRELLAGRAAEEVFFGNVCGGSGGSADSDLARATTLAVSCEASWGLGKTLSWYGDMNADECGRFISMRPDVAARVEARLAAAYADTLAMVRDRRHSIEALARVLLKREVLTGDDVRTVLTSAAEAHAADQCEIADGDPAVLT